MELALVHLFNFRGYIEAIRELEEQLHTLADSRKFDDIVVACGRSVHNFIDLLTRFTIHAKRVLSWRIGSRQR